MRRIRHRFLLTLALVSGVLLTAACTSPGPRVTTEPRPTAALAAPRAHEFVSTVYDFRLTLPEDWTGVDAAPYDSWDGVQLPGMSSTAFADFTDSTGNRLFAVGAAPVVMGTTLAAWQRAMVRAHDFDCADLRPLRPTRTTTFGGERALTWMSKCDDEIHMYLAVVHGTRGYVAEFLPYESSISAADLALYGAMLRSLHFTS
ncbi:MAG TPA: hypothetical protein VIG76_00935 [Amnibacterium sp.]|jgi:hypothetical protein|uniref:hypothetical protein n=1 Tax=Amnibacterium sp. TaxID=1872496 RepID=UPI002F93B1B3